MINATITCSHCGKSTMHIMDANEMYSFAPCECQKVKAEHNFCPECGLALKNCMHKEWCSRILKPDYSIGQNSMSASRYEDPSATHNPKYLTCRICSKTYNEYDTHICPDVIFDKPKTETYPICKSCSAVMMDENKLKHVAWLIKNTGYYEIRYYPTTTTLLECESYQRVPQFDVYEGGT